MITCPLCGTPNVEAGKLPDRQLNWVECTGCGRYKMSPHVMTALGKDAWRDRKHHLAAIAYRSRGEQSPEFTTDSIPELLNTVAPPTNLLAAMDRLLLHIHDRLPDITRAAVLDRRTHYEFFLASPDDLKALLNELQEMNLLTWASTPSGYECSLTIEGWRTVQRLRAEGPHSAKAFVAMSFEPSLDAAWKAGFEPALREAGWEPLRMKELEHNDKICDRILAEIRMAGLLVADFTSHRAGVYFEAGFAAGLGIPVIWTVQDSELAKTHFDTRQYNHIVWTAPSDLKEKLALRVAATMRTPRRPDA